MSDDGVALMSMSHPHADTRSWWTRIKGWLIGDLLNEDAITVAAIEERQDWRPWLTKSDAVLALGRPVSLGDLIEVDSRKYICTGWSNDEPRWLTLQECANEFVTAGPTLSPLLRDAFLRVLPPPRQPPRQPLNVQPLP